MIKTVLLIRPRLLSREKPRFLVDYSRTWYLQTYIHRYIYINSSVKLPSFFKSVNFTMAIPVFSSSLRLGRIPTLSKLMLRLMNRAWIAQSKRGKKAAHTEGGRQAAAATNGFHRWRHHSTHTSPTADTITESAIAGFLLLLWLIFCIKTKQSLSASASASGCESQYHTLFGQRKGKKETKREAVAAVAAAATVSNPLVD